MPQNADGSARAWRIGGSGGSCDDEAPAGSWTGLLVVGWLLVAGNPRWGLALHFYRLNVVM